MPRPRARSSSRAPAARARRVARPAASVLVLHGPNLNLLGTRETGIYGAESLASINTRLKARGKELGLAVTTRQSNSEGELVDLIQAARGKHGVLILNPAAYGHTSIAVRDAVLAVGIPVIEVHLSNIHKREDFRQRTLLQDIADGIIMGFGPLSYDLALEAAARLAATRGRPAASSAERAS